MNLSIKIGKLKLTNPIMVASGTFGYGEEFENLTDLNKIGAIITKTITLNPRLGNSQPRVVETVGGMLNAIGLQNDGVDYFIKYKVPFFKKLNVPLIVSISGDSVDDYVRLAKKINVIKEVSAIELNLSCPNINGRQCLISQDHASTFKTVSSVRKVYNKTLIAKLTPNVTDIVLIARAASDARADAISLVNTFLGMSIDIETRKPGLGNITGGLSGPAIKPIALRMVWQVAQKLNIPIIGIGGIMNYRDALEFIIAGAKAIQVGTANFVNPRATVEILGGIENYLKNKKIKDINKLIGSLKI